MKMHIHVSKYQFKNDYKTSKVPELIIINQTIKKFGIQKGIRIREQKPNPQNFVDKI